MQRYLTICMLIVSVAHAYKLDKKLDAGNFLGFFDFIDTPDKYTGGCVSYISKSEATSMGLACVVGNQVYLVVDNNAVIDVKPQGGRKSILRIFQLTPAACDLPSGSYTMMASMATSTQEIDILESVSYLARNEITLGTKPGTAEIHGTNCDYDARGFEATAPPGTFGDSFNQDSGGVWATQIEAEDIEVWHFKRSAIPADVASDTLDPSTWGKPVLSMLPQNCDISKIFNITFCGESAGGGARNGQTECRARTGVASCNDFVATTPSAFDEVYFLVNSVKTYTK
ncbi:hypothetical protein N0V91_002581 [Didymella pomorum]|uniref:Uncharacterized protein n=1 Tax=Didymella pomorum TaxID=749634 RepID=A0A9W9DA44_9PLEO|nr:hypothetical protein N0V91_002581 [Didymella pomorum]